MFKNLENLEKELQKLNLKYSKVLEEKERMRKRQQDVHLTPEDKKVLIESFVIGGIMENIITKVISRVL
ncbi:hypothetical protein JCM14244_05080 [Venenivibrio stagnispumantis]|uniref:Uncharacterized protein n=1 Tax=Venenivibrio stagnispumantis TaxID=407998 RepID=A0AA46AFS5_9AQUI|nr:hypothetical protein [Venenivibrio stagnispumantis]MCW4572682.1 hypothetical protein [Venenivibrio stagnispumantis]SMP21444.1 hypothetical protein SAMN06264868_12317 [Venenivibrio stagnispumantis]